MHIIKGSLESPITSLGPHLPVEDAGLREVVFVGGVVARDVADGEGRLQHGAVVHGPGEAVGEVVGRASLGGWRRS